MRPVPIAPARRAGARGALSNEFESVRARLADRDDKLDAALVLFRVGRQRRLHAVVLDNVGGAVVVSDPLVGGPRSFAAWHSEVKTRYRGVTGAWSMPLVRRDGRLVPQQEPGWRPDDDLAALRDLPIEGGPDDGQIAPEPYPLGIGRLSPARMADAVVVSRNRAEDAALVWEAAADGGTASAAQRHALLERIVAEAPWDTPADLRLLAQLHVVLLHVSAAGRAVGLTLDRPGDATGWLQLTVVLGADPYPGDVRDADVRTVTATDPDEC